MMFALDDTSACRCLPNNILVHIFSFAVPDFSNGLAEIGTEYFPLRIGSICKRWRSLAWHAPQLWTRLVITIPSEDLADYAKLLDDMFSKSADRPLELQINLPDIRVDWTEEEPMLDAIQAQAPRCVGLYTYMDSGELEVLESRGPFKHLKRYFKHAKPECNLEIIFAMLYHARGLETGFFNKLTCSVELGLVQAVAPFGRLKHNLRELRVSASQSSADTWPTLIETLFPYLQLPSLKILDICNLSTLTNQATECFKTFLSVSGCQLVRFHIRDIYVGDNWESSHEANLVSILRDMPELEDLRIAFSKPYRNAMSMITDGFFKHLSLSKGDPTFLPKLTSFFYQGYRKFTWATFSEMFWVRGGLTKDHRTLRTVEVLLDEWNDDFVNRDLLPRFIDVPPTLSIRLYGAPWGSPRLDLLNESLTRRSTC